MKKYTKPAVEAIELQVEDVICTSGKLNSLPTIVDFGTGNGAYSASGYGEYTLTDDIIEY